VYADRLLLLLPLLGDSARDAGASMPVHRMSRVLASNESAVRFAGTS
jgi:hypothetical protein